MHLPNTLYHICCGIQCYLRGNGKPHIDFFSDPDFFDFKCSLDAEMKVAKHSNRIKTKAS